MSENFRLLHTHPDYVRAQHVGYSVRLVADIAAHYNDALDALDTLKSMCMLDAFYVHIRLLTEFLVRTQGSRDFRPEDFGVDWSAPVGESADRLLATWDVASKHVVHFGQRRLPSASDDKREFTVNAAHFRLLVTDAFGFYATFVDAVAATAPAWSRGALIPDPAREPEDWAARVRSDVVRELREAQAYAQRSLEA
ncbi:MAG TPA: hypothetical protein VFE45_10320 [Coriobacteriia bacterium]|nr:hypothetical protein [Coriobacteriia bacterium]